MIMPKSFSNKKPFSLANIETYFEKYVVNKLISTTIQYDVKIEHQNGIEVRIDDNTYFQISRAFFASQYSIKDIREKFSKLEFEFNSTLHMLEVLSLDEKNDLNSILDSVIVGASPIRNCSDEGTIFYTVFNVKENYKHLFEREK